MKILEAIGSVIAALLGLLLTFVFLSSSLGVVREYCLNAAATRATQTVVVDKHWTYILWPPLVFAGNDPPGFCVRNTPARQALDAIGIWKLPSPEEQVREHVAAQLRSR
jgi:hypothetical protein